MDLTYLLTSDLRVNILEYTPLGSILYLCQICTTLSTLLDNNFELLLRRDGYSDINSKHKHARLEYIMRQSVHEWTTFTEHIVDSHDELALRIRFLPDDMSELVDNYIDNYEYSTSITIALIETGRKHLFDLACKDGIDDRLSYIHKILCIDDNPLWEKDRLWRKDHRDDPDTYNIICEKILTLLEPLSNEHTLEIVDNIDINAVDLVKMIFSRWPEIKKCYMRSYREQYNNFMGCTFLDAILDMNTKVLKTCMIYHDHVIPIGDLRKTNLITIDHFRYLYSVKESHSIKSINIPAIIGRLIPVTPCWILETVFQDDTLKPLFCGLSRDFLFENRYDFTRYKLMCKYDIGNSDIDLTALSRGTTRIVNMITPLAQKLNEEYIEVYIKDESTLKTLLKECDDMDKLMSDIRATSLPVWATIVVYNEYLHRKGVIIPNENCCSEK